MKKIIQTDGVMNDKYCIEPRTRGISYTQ